MYAFLWNWLYFYMLNTIRVIRIDFGVYFLLLILYLRHELSTYYKVIYEKLLAELTCSNYI